MAVPKDMGISRANISGEHQIELELTNVAGKTFHSSLPSLCRIVTRLQIGTCIIIIS